MITRKAVALWLAVVLGLAACGGDDDPQPALSATATATASVTPSPSPSPTPTEVAAPLTGELVEPEVAQRPALIAKIENTAQARPQAGLEAADLVIEELVEGGITRFLAVFQSEVPAQIGPVRSARLVDATLLPALNGVFLYSGGRSDVEASIAGTAVLVTEGAAGVFRDSGRRRPSNLFGDGPQVYDTAEQRDGELGPPQAWFTFDEEVPPGGTDGEQIDISMSPQTTASWAYDEGAGAYLRSQDGAEQPTASGDPVQAANVVVLGVGTYQGGCCDTNGSPYVVTETIDTGRAIVLRDGQWFEAEWSRGDAASPVELTMDGQVLHLRPGATWLHLTARERLPAVSPTGSPSPSDAGG